MLVSAAEWLENCSKSPFNCAFVWILQLLPGQVSYLFLKCFLELKLFGPYERGVCFDYMNSYKVGKKLHGPIVQLVENPVRKIYWNILTLQVNWIFTFRSLACSWAISSFLCSYRRVAWRFSKKIPPSETRWVSYTWKLLGHVKYGRPGLLAKNRSVLSKYLDHAQIKDFLHCLPLLCVREIYKSYENVIWSSKTIWQWCNNTFMKTRM